jgi:hypothetical protein
LCFLGCACTVLYLIIAVIFWTDALFRQSRALEIAIFATIALLAVLYFGGIRLVDQTTTRTVRVFACLFAFLGFVSGPVDSTDVFFYIAQGWGQSHYGSNPYSQVLRDIPQSGNDPMIASRWMVLNRNPWLDEPLPYGFLFALVTRSIAWLGQGNWWLTLALFNFLNLIMHASIIYLLWRLASMMPGANPHLIVYLYTWSPLVVLQFLINVHNDILMAALILFAFYLRTRKCYAWVMPALVAAGFVKYAAFALIPFVIVFLIQQRAYKALFRGLMASAVLATIVSLPYASAFTAFKFGQIVEQYTESSGSLHAFITFTVRSVARSIGAGAFDLGIFGRYAKAFFWTVVLLFIVWQLVRNWITAEDAPVDVVRRWTSVLFAIIFVGSSQFYSWYIGMVFPLSLLAAGQSRITYLIVLLSSTHLLFAFLRGKAIGYFLASTAIPVLIAYVRRQNSSISPRCW